MKLIFSIFSIGVPASLFLLTRRSVALSDGKGETRQGHDGGQLVPADRSRSLQQCTDQAGWVDAWGTPCSWYVTNTWACEDYKPHQGASSSNEACCVCGGGSGSAPSPGSCTDQAGWVDAWGTPCSWYVTNTWACEDYKPHQGASSSNEACCVCGGGSGTVPGPAPGPAPAPIPCTVTQDEWEQVFSSTGKSTSFATEEKRQTYNQYCLSFGNIESKLEAAMFMAQALHESDLNVVREVHPRPDYGNYYGRGYLQLTWECGRSGCPNDQMGYHGFGKFMADQGLVHHEDRFRQYPDEVATLYPMVSALWIWGSSVGKNLKEWGNGGSVAVTGEHFGLTTNNINGWNECCSPTMNVGQYNPNGYGPNQPCCGGGFPETCGGTDRARTRYEYYGRIAAAWGLGHSLSSQGCPLYLEGTI